MEAKAKALNGPRKHDTNITVGIERCSFNFMVSVRVGEWISVAVICTATGPHKYE